MKPRNEQDDHVREPEDQADAARWFGLVTDLRYSFLGPKDGYKRLPQVAPDKKPRKEPAADSSLFVPGPGKAGLAKLPASHWLDVRRAYADRLLRERQFEQRKARRLSDGPPQPGVPGANNWVPLGPAVVRKGQATGNPPVGGRVCRLAIAPGGLRAYAATADGGVWRSDDAGTSWRSLMDGFDLDPTAFAATSSACGAIAIDPADPERVYVGTGEADTNGLFTSRIVSALPTYRGVGPVRSDDGGATWNSEATAPGSPTLVGSAFFALAVDPGDRNNVVAATVDGLYRREADGAGGFHWVQRRPGIHTSVVACRLGTVTTFFAVAFGGAVFASADGASWTAAGTVAAGAGRITLGVRPTDPAVLYAFAATAAGSGFLGLFRLDGGAGAWRPVTGLPTLGGQGDYNLPIAVDPNNANLVYLAGSAFGGNGSIFRCAVTSAGAGAGLTFSMTTTFIGSGVHADVHDLVHTPGDSATLWTGTDGGVFQTTAATGAAAFVHKNTGLACLCGNFFAQHPTQPAVILLGLQDNGTARYTGEECWLHNFDGDGGYPVINWADPNRVLVYANGAVRRATDGGQGTSSFTTVHAPQWMVMAEPLVGTPYRPGTPADAETVAFGAGPRLFISTDFGVTWPAAVATMAQNIFALTFASATQLYLGTVFGQVFRFDRAGAVWTQTRIDNAAGGGLPLSGLVTDIEVDPADATGASIYITFGGSGDRRHVWHFNGTSWQDRSGPVATGLLDVSHNALVADPASPTTLYIASDIGVWISTDAGGNWAPMQNGLPDAAVFDVQIHPTVRLLRASTYGRGMYEFKLDPPAQADVELYIRDTSLDVGRGATVDGLPDPEVWPVQPVLHYLSRNMKVDVPTPAGYQTPTSAIDFLTFNDVIVDGSEHTATMDPTTGTVTNRVYVEVHNRGIVEAASVQVMLLLTNASAGLAPLPAGYEANVQAGTAIASGGWQTVGVRTVTNLRVGFPQVAAFNLPSTMLPPPASLPGQAHHCLLAIVHSAQDVYTTTQMLVDPLAIAERKVGQRNLHVVAFVGTPPPPGAGIWSRLELHGRKGDDSLRELVLDTRGYKGRLGVLLPDDLRVREVVGLRESREEYVPAWAKDHSARLNELIAKGRFNVRACREMQLDIRRVADRPLLLGTVKKAEELALKGLALESGKRYPVFLYFEPEQLEIGQSQAVHVILRDPKTKRVEGGSTYHLVVTPKGKA